MCFNFFCLVEFKKGNEHEKDQRNATTTCATYRSNYEWRYSLQHTLFVNVAI